MGKSGKKGRWALRLSASSDEISRLRDLMTHRERAYMDALGGETTNPETIRTRAEKWKQARDAYNRALKRKYRA